MTVLVTVLAVVALAVAAVGMLRVAARASARRKLARLLQSDEVQREVAELDAFRDALTPVVWRVVDSGEPDLLRLEEPSGPREWTLVLDPAHGPPPPPGAEVRLDPLGDDGFEVWRVEEWDDRDADPAVADLLHESSGSSHAAAPRWPTG